MDSSLTTSIWQEFSAPLKSYLLKHTRNAFVSDDLLQEIFMRIHEKSHTIRNTESLKSWVYTIARHVLMDYFRRNNLSSDVESLPEIADENSSADMHNCLFPFVNRLPEPYRSTLTRTELEGMKHKLLAEEEGISLSAVKSRVQRGREMIRDMFISCCHFRMNEDGKLAGEHKNPDECTLCKGN